MRRTPPAARARCDAGDHHAAARLYIATVDPVHHAMIVIDNKDLANPQLEVR